MEAAVGFLGLCFVLIVGIVAAERRWHKAHPGADQMFSKIDDELRLAEDRE